MPRRNALHTTRVNPDPKPAWSYQSSYFHGTPLVGTFHISDIVQIFYGLPPRPEAAVHRNYLLNFLHNLDPNSHNLLNWPAWENNTRTMMSFETGQHRLAADDYRQDVSDFMLSKHHELFA